MNTALFSKTRNMIKSSGGFTLIELLVVLAIIGLLSSLIIVSLSASKDSALTAGNRADFSRAQVGLELYYNQHGGYPPSISVEGHTDGKKDFCCLKGTSCMFEDVEFKACAVTLPNGAFSAAPQKTNILGTVAYAQTPQSYELVALGGKNYSKNTILYACENTMRLPSGDTICLHGLLAAATNDTIITQEVGSEIFIDLSTPTTTATTTGSVDNTKPGCTEPGYLNYDPFATVNNGTCVPFIYGCTTVGALNYDMYANSPTTCNFENGTTTPSSVSSSSVTPPQSSSSYTPPSSSVTPPPQSSSSYTPPSSSVTPPPQSSSSYTPPPQSSVNPTVSSSNAGHGGCMDSGADNYDATATYSSGTCIKSGCTNPSAYNYYPGANHDDGSCVILGCTDGSASNYNSQANIDNGSCTYPSSSYSWGGSGSYADPDPYGGSY